MKDIKTITMERNGNVWEMVQYIGHYGREILGACEYKTLEDGTDYFRYNFKNGDFLDVRSTEDTDPNRTGLLEFFDSRTKEVRNGLNPIEGADMVLIYSKTLGGYHEDY